MRKKTLSLKIAAAITLASAVTAPVQATESAPVTSQQATAASGLPASFKKKAKRDFYRDCKSSKKFAEKRFAYTPHAVLAGRCIMSKKWLKGVKLVSSYQGHHPSATHALDVMVNLRGSCSVGNSTGDRIAKYLMNNAKKHGIKYLIWENRYWASTSAPKKLRQWRNMNRGGCTHGHYDHVHVAFK